MAKQSNLKVQIANIEKDPRHVDRMIISLKIDDGDKSGPYIKPFSMLPPDHVISVDEFLNSLISMQDLSRPVDPYQYLKDAQETRRTFNLDLADVPTTNDDTASEIKH